MKKMKLSLFLAAMMAVSSLSFAQSNDKGVIQIGLGWGLQAGGGKLDQSGGGQSLNSDLIGARINYGIRAQYGVAKNISVGLFLRREGAAYVFPTSSVYSGGFATYGVGVGVEGKYYLLNKDKFNIYAAPSVGYSGGSSYYTNSSSTTTSMSGINYGLSAGFNWYWAKFIGMSLDLGYAGVSLSGKDNSLYSGTTITDKVTAGGIYFGFGLITKFGGN